MPRLRPWLAFAIALTLAAPPALAQAPKTGRVVYEDAVDLGFKLRTPDGWQFVPPSPDDTNLIGKYDAGAGKVIADKGKAGFVSFIPYSMWLLKFDRRKPEDGGFQAPKDRHVRAPARDVVKWVENGGTGVAGFLKDYEEPFKAAKHGATEMQFQGRFGSDEPIRLYAVVHHLTPETDVAIVFIGPGDGERDGKWRKLTRAYKSVAGSLEPVEVVRSSGGPAGTTLRDHKRHELQAEAARSPGWELYETPNYFVISNSTDKAFLAEVCERLEAIRKVYEETYPPALAAELRQVRKQVEAQKKAEEAAKGGAADAGKEPEGAKPGGEAGEPEDGAGEDGAEGADGKGKDEVEDERTVSSRADPMELSRTSVVRVCGSAREYQSYGGPGGSAGYWSANDRELVIYDDQQVGGRRNTWATLNHEAFHQYIYYFFGNLSPHDWYNEGTGDFYSGYELKNKRFELKEFDWRNRQIEQNIRESKKDGRMIVPLKEFVRYERKDYYSQTETKYGTKIGDHYAQGWSFIYFLRTGAKKARCWNPAWDSILDTYLRTLVETDDLEAAVEAAFQGVDWEELEACWKDYIG